MVKRTKIYATAVVATLLMLGISMKAHATPMRLNGGGTITEENTEFAYTETGLNDYQIADQEVGIFGLYLSNFAWAGTTDHLTWDIEGIVAGQLDAGSYSAQWTISYEKMYSILLDGEVNLTIHYCEMEPIKTTTSTGLFSRHRPDTDTDWGSSGGTFAWDLSYESGSSEPVPEPATMLLMATGLLGLGAARRKKKTV